MVSLQAHRDIFRAQAANQWPAPSQWGSAIALLKQRMMPMRTGRTPEKPADPSKLGLPAAPKSFYLFDSSDASVGRISYVTKNMNEITAFYKGKAKKGPFPLQEFKDKYRYQFQDEDEAMNRVREAEGKELENAQPPDPSNLEAYTAFMQKIASVGAKQGSRMYLDSYEPKLFGSPTVYILEERQIGKRSYPTRYVVTYQEQALKMPGYRLSWMTVSDDAIQTAQANLLALGPVSHIDNSPDIAVGPPEQGVVLPLDSRFPQAGHPVSRCDHPDWPWRRIRHIG